MRKNDCFVRRFLTGQGVGMLWAIWVLVMVMVGSPGWPGMQLVHAQDAGYSLSPVAASDEDGNYGFGVRWGLDLSPQPRIRPSLDFPSELWYELKMNGAILTDADVNAEPAGQVFLDFGWRLSLSSQRPFDMQHPDRELLKFDLGYLFVGLQGYAGVDQPFEESIAGIGAVVHYRRTALYGGLRPLIPNLRFGFANNFVLMSEVYDMQDVNTDPYRQIDLGAYWTFRSVSAATPVWFNNLRWMAGVNYFHRLGLEPDAVAVTDESGINYHFDLGYELSGVTRYLNYMFIRYSAGTFPVLLADRKQWMVGITIGNL